jgi:hypothetical protein
MENGTVRAPSVGAVRSAFNWPRPIGQRVAAGSSSSRGVGQRLGDCVCSYPIHHCPGLLGGRWNRFGPAPSVQPGARTPDPWWLGPGLRRCHLLFVGLPVAPVFPVIPELCGLLCAHLRAAMASGRRRGPGGADGTGARATTSGARACAAGALRDRRFGLCYAESPEAVAWEGVRRRQDPPAPEPAGRLAERN